MKVVKTVFCRGVPYGATDGAYKTSEVHSHERTGRAPFICIEAYIGRETRVGLALVSMCCFELRIMSAQYYNFKKVSSSNETPVSAVDFSPPPKMF